MHAQAFFNHSICLFVGIPKVRLFLEIVEQSNNDQERNSEGISISYLLLFCLQRVVSNNSRHFTFMF